MKTIRAHQRGPTTESIKAAREWVRTDLPSIRDDILRHGLHGATAYNMRLIKECLRRGDDRWASITRESLCLVLVVLEDD